MTRGTNGRAILLSSMEVKHTYDAIQWCPKLMGYH